MTLRNAALAAVAISPALFAHDMWIEPASFVPAVDQVVGIRLRVGQDLIGDPLPRNPSLINQFVVEDATGRKPVLGRDGANPAGFLRLTAPGLRVIGYRSHRSSVEQAPEQFARYLKEEGLEQVARTARPGSANVREVFSRCAKSLIAIGDIAPGQDDRALGFTLELVAERNPYTLAAGGELPVRLTFEGKPLPGALVVAMSRLDPAAKLSARTGADGRVRFRLRDPGMWLIKAVHMTPAPKGVDAEWESFWASLTFEMRGAAAVKAD